MLRLNAAAWPPSQPALAGTPRRSVRLGAVRTPQRGIPTKLKPPIKGLMRPHKCPAGKKTPRGTFRQSWIHFPTPCSNFFPPSWLALTATFAIAYQPFALCPCAIRWSNRRALSRIYAVQRPVPPHPNPLPRGEGWGEGEQHV